MHIKIVAKQSLEKQDVVHLLILLTITLCVGIYLIVSTVVIAKDGVTFIEYAKCLEINPAQTMVEQDQHPGYPTTILGIHKATRSLCEGKPEFSWIYSAQSVALMFRVFAIVILYFIGKNLVGAQFSFWGVLILIFLPKPAAYGSDALSDWPHLFFLAGGFLLLLQGAIHRRGKLFGFVGLVAGLGYLVRPECAQLVVYGSLWLGLQLLWGKKTLGGPKTVFALVLLIVGFLIVVGPYMKLKGTVFPKKHAGKFALSTQASSVYHSQQQIVSNTAYIAPLHVAGAFAKLFENIGETLMWFFVPALLVGWYKYFRKQNWYEPEVFYVIVFIVLNIFLVLWLYCKFGYMSNRHTLPLVMFTIFCIPVGLQALAAWLEKRFPKGTQVWFIVLIMVGIVICTPKLLRPLHHDKLIFRKAAQWLAENTLEDDLIAVPDSRISFYSGRKGIDYKHHAFSENVQYVVRVYKKKNLSGNDNLPRQANILYTDDSDDKYRIDIYKSVN